MRRWASLLVLFLCTAGIPAQEARTLAPPVLSPPPGNYTAAVRIELRSPDASLVRYRFAESSSAQTFAWSGPLVLDAVPGETRTSTLRLTVDLPSGETLSQDYRYQIAVPADPGPTLRPAPGLFTQGVQVQASLPSGWELFRDGAKQDSLRVPLDVPAGKKATFILEVRGPQGAVVRWPYTIDRRDQEEATLDVISPAPGNWANAQILALDFRGIDQVLWSEGEHLDSAKAQVYAGPVAFSGEGERTVTVAGHTRAGRWIERTVRWTNGTDPPPAETWPDSGVVSQLQIPAVPGWEQSWDGRSWSPQTTLAETATARVRKVLVLGLRKGGSILRYVYWLDAKKPSVPTGEFFGGWNPVLGFSGSAGVLHKVIWTLADGKVLEDPLPLWGPCGSWKIPDQAVSAQIAAGDAGQKVLSSPITFPQTGWATPGWEPWDRDGPLQDRNGPAVGGRVPPREGFLPVYEISDLPEVHEPSGSSPVLDGALLPAVPPGADRTFFVRFAWKDAAGLVGPASPVWSMRVDRIPPQAPEVAEVDGEVVVRSVGGEDARLFWAVSSERADFADSLSFQPYEASLAVSKIRPPGPQAWFHAYAVDKSGNRGPARLNLALSPPSPGGPLTVFQSDPSPSVGDIPVANGGVYPWRQLRLRPGDLRTDYWVAVTDQAEVPQDWKNRLTPWTVPVVRSVSSGQRQAFLVYWNAKTPWGWSTEQPSTLLLTLDQGLPAPPVIAGAWPQAPLSSAWTLEVRPGRPGDKVRFTATTNGEPPSDPAQGEELPQSRSWDAPAGGRVEIRVRLAAVSAGGLATEYPVPGPVIIDRTVPGEAAPRLPLLSYRSGPAMVELPSHAPAVRYVLTSDGSVPAVPDASSPQVPPSGLVLPGEEGKTLVYKFRWRPFSGSGVPGPVTETYSVVVDRTVPLVSSQGAGPPEGLGPPPLDGVPASGISASPVTLRADWPQGILRFEVAEGVGNPRAVTADSSIWPGSLVLDGGPGMDRTFVVSVRGFSPEGQPLTSESRTTVRVDRAVPGAPVFSMEPDRRYPQAGLKPGPHNPDETLYYRWSWTSFEGGQGEIEWTPVSQELPLFVAKDGLLTRLQVQAFLKDEAGNTGPVTEVSVLLDQNVVYAAPQGTGDGTRDHPVGTVAAAVEKMRKEGRTVLFLAAGSYPVAQTLNWEGFQVLGGWDASSWDLDQTPGRSVLSAEVPFAGASLLESGSSPWSLKRVDLRVAAGTAPALAVIRGTRVAVSQSTWTLAQAGGWDQEGGAFAGDALSIASASSSAGPLWKFVSATVDLHDVSAAVEGPRNGVLVEMINCQTLVRNLVLESRQAQGFDGIWSASGGRLTVDGAKIQAGDHASRSTAFAFRQVDATFWNIGIELNAGQASTAFQTTGGNLELHKASVTLLQGDEFNQGFVLDHTDAALRDFQVAISRGAYQGGFSVDGGSLSLASGTVQLSGGGRKVWGAQFSSPALVSIEDVSWILKTRTPGDLWKIDQPWEKGSSVTRSQTEGW